MTLQPPSGYEDATNPPVEAPEPISPPLTTPADVSEPTPGLAPDSPANEVDAPAPHEATGPSSVEESHAREESRGGSPAEGVNTPGIPPAARLLSSPPAGLSVVGGQRIRLRKAVALDRVASGHGALTISWNQRRQGLDLVALNEGSAITTRGSSIVIDLSQPMRRVLIGTGTRGTFPLPPSELIVSNGATEVVVPILGGTSLGVWPRLSIARVDEFVVLRHELDPLSGVLNAVAQAYGYDQRTFLLAHTT